MFKTLEWSKLISIHCIDYSYAPTAFANAWPKNNERYMGMPLCNENDYVLPLPRIEFFKKFLFIHYLLHGMTQAY
jgi:hypothetical protein